MKNLSCYEEFVIRRDISGCSSKEFLDNCNNVIYYNNHYYLWTDDGLLTMFDDNGNEIDNPNITVLYGEMIPCDITKCIIPNGVIEISDYAFSCCTSLKSIIIPNSVAELCTGTFSYCTSIKSITIPNSVTKICNGSFWRCESLKSITLPKRFKNKNITFSNCHPDLKINYV